MNCYTFTPSAVIENGTSYAAQYTGHGSAIIVRFAGRQLVLTPGHAQYVEAAHAFAAAIRSKEEQSAADLLQVAPTVLHLHTPQDCITSDDEAHELEELEALGIKPAVPDIEGAEILATGQGWRFILDAQQKRTRLIFDAAPTQKALQPIEEARFFWSPNMGSFNKKLTLKARRAALELADELERIGA